MGRELSNKIHQDKKEATGSEMLKGLRAELLSVQSVYPTVVIQNEQQNLDSVYLQIMDVEKA